MHGIHGKCEVEIRDRGDRGSLTIKNTKARRVEVGIFQIERIGKLNYCFLLKEMKDV